jgi:CheY-like chemotaxis protein
MIHEKLVAPEIFCPLRFIPGLAFWQAGNAKTFAFFPALTHAGCMTQPLALVFYEKLMPGSQLVNKLQDLNYRVQTVNNPVSFHLCARDEKPLLAIVDLSGGDSVCSAITALKADAATGHIPVIAFTNEMALEMMAKARKAGAELAVNEAAITNHLPELLNQALHIE